MEMWTVEPRAQSGAHARDSRDCMQKATSKRHRSHPFLTAQASPALANRHAHAAEDEWV